MYIDEERGTLHFKIVCWGPGIVGRTSSVDAVQPWSRESTSYQEFFRLSIVDWQELPDEAPRIQLHVVIQGNVNPMECRRQVLMDVDAVLCVWDSQRPRDEANQAVLEWLGSFLSEQGRDVRDLPLVHQYNKRDLGGSEGVGRISVAEHETTLNPDGRPSFGSVARLGIGVHAAFRTLVRSLLGSQRCLHVRAPSGSELEARLTRWLDDQRQEQRHRLRTKLEENLSEVITPAPVDDIIADCFDHGRLLFQAGERSGDWLRILHDEDLTELGTRLSEELNTDTLVTWQQRLPSLASLELWSSGELQRQCSSSTADGDQESFDETELRRTCASLGVELPPPPRAWRLLRSEEPPASID